MGEHVHGKGDDVHVAGPLSVAKEGALYTVCTRQHAKLCVTDAASPVIMGMKAEGNRIPVF